MLTVLGMASFMVNNAFAQIGWTLEQCRKHWGMERIREIDGTYTFGYGFALRSGSLFEKRVVFDRQGKVTDVTYFSNGNNTEGDGRPPVLDIPALLAIEKGVTWGPDPDQEGTTSRHEYFLGKKDGVALFHARYFSGKVGESLHVLPIDKPF